jgi:hypothetical protein
MYVQAIYENVMMSKKESSSDISTLFLRRLFLGNDLWKYQDLDPESCTFGN